MLTELFKRLNAIRIMSDELKVVLTKDLEIIEVPKRTVLLKDGERCDYAYVVLSGLMRMYYIKEGEEICSRFMDEEHICISVFSFFTRNPGYEYIETIENCTLARIHIDKLQKIYNEIIEFNFIIRVITEQYFIKSEERLFLLRRQTVEERYNYFTNHYPELLQRVPLKYIATFLGTSLETISRLRNKLSKPVRQ
jgi:CRP-like cAMP-binding protein